MKEIKELKEIILDLPKINKANGEKECYNIFTNQINKLSDIRKNFSKIEDVRCTNMFRKEILKYVLKSEFVKYVYEKPRGYAGDFMTMQIIWNGCTDNKNRYLGTTEIGKLISALTLDMHACQAIIKRIIFLKDELTKAGKRFASIGCGPCIEYWNASNELHNDVDVFLLDQDSGALDSAKKQIKRNNHQFYFHNDNILKFILDRDKIKLMGKRDLIYSVGMLDYFSIKNSARIINRLWESVSSGGLIIITNAHPDNPTRLWMEYAGDWFLCYKTKKQMFEIADGLKNVNSIDYIMDNQNVFQYLKIRKN